MPRKTARFSRDSFPRSRAKKNTHRTSWGSVSVYPEKSGVAVVVSKKILSKAHDRNRLKRRLYAALDEALSNSKMPGVVVYPRKEALTEKHTVLIEELKKALESSK